MCTTPRSPTKTDDALDAPCICLILSHFFTMRYHIHIFHVIILIPFYLFTLCSSLILVHFTPFFSNIVNAFFAPLCLQIGSPKAAILTVKGSVAVTTRRMMQLQGVFMQNKRRTI